MFLVVVALSVPVLYSYFVYTPTVNVRRGICHTMQFYVTNISESHAIYSCLACHEITVGGIGDNLDEPNDPVAELVRRDVAKLARPNLKAGGRVHYVGL